MKKRYVFDIDLAREYVREGHEVMELDADDVEYSLGRCEINEGHVPHVDPSIPGIVSHLFFPDEDGTVVHGHRLIDGHHRAARCRQLGIPFPVYVLTEIESQEVLTRAPEGARPDLEAEEKTRAEKADRKRRKTRRKQARRRRQSSPVA